MFVARTIALIVGFTIAVVVAARPAPVDLNGRPLRANIARIIATIDGMKSSAPLATATLSPDEIYSKSVHEMRSLAHTGNPPYLVFDLHLVSHNLHWYPQTDDGLTDWEVRLVHANETADYRVWYRSKDERALVQDAATHAAYEGESPFAPETTDFSDMTGTKSTPLPSPSPAAGKASDAPAQVIGAITVNGSQHYAIDLVGMEQRDGRQTYHLHLRAFRDAMDYPLTDLWVDSSDYRIVGAHGEVTVRAVAALLGVGVTADFAQADKYWLVSTMDVSLKGYIAFWHANTETSMTASVVSIPATLPESYFKNATTPASAHR
ncbi:MAG TPA: hypothetical protein VFO25_06840 [Candidatus Eremiobacteraceae bacterium]|nr:hypothetical protein [Candidatus Eremiobacteraceae bacterium]